MLSPKQQTLGFANYPVGRPAFFAIRFQCHVLRRGVAYEVGTDGLAILMLVSTAEDRTRYSKPVAFWNDHLCGMVGLSRERFFAARKKLVERGWLCYSPGARGRAPTYFVTVPGGDQEIDGSMLGETPADEVIREEDEREETRANGQCKEFNDGLDRHSLRSPHSSVSVLDSHPGGRSSISPQRYGLAAGEGCGGSGPDDRERSTLNLPEPARLSLCGQGVKTESDSGSAPADQIETRRPSVELGRISRPNSPPIAVSIHHQSPTQFTTPSSLSTESEESSSLSPERLSERNTLSASPLPREEEFEEEAQGLEPRASGHQEEFNLIRTEKRKGRDALELGSHLAAAERGHTHGGEWDGENGSRIVTDAIHEPGSIDVPVHEATLRRSTDVLLRGPGTPVNLGRPEGDLRGRVSELTSSPLGRNDLLALLRNDFPAGFGIHRSTWTLDTALKSITLEQAAAIVSHAWDQQIDGVLPWEAGAVVMRLTDPDLVSLPPEEGWAPPNPEWVKLDQRRKHAAESAERQRLAAEKAQADEDKRVAENAKREQLELAFGRTLDELEQTAPDRLWSILRECGMESFVRKSGSGFRGKLARQKLLRAVEAGQLGEGY